MAGEQMSWVDIALKQPNNFTRAWSCRFEYLVKNESGATRSGGTKCLIATGNRSAVLTIFRSAHSAVKFLVLVFGFGFWAWFWFWFCVLANSQEPKAALFLSAFIRVALW